MSRAHFSQELRRATLQGEGFGRRGPVLTGLENFLIYYIPQRVTNSPSLGRVLFLTRFEQRPTTVLLQQSSGTFVIPVTGISCSTYFSIVTVCTANLFSNAKSSLSRPRFCENELCRWVEEAGLGRKLSKAHSIVKAGAKRGYIRGTHFPDESHIEGPKPSYEKGKYKVLCPSPSAHPKSALPAHLFSWVVVAACSRTSSK
jgi:hypothetical protein